MPTNVVSLDLSSEVFSTSEVGGVAENPSVELDEGNEEAVDVVCVSEEPEEVVVIAAYRFEVLCCVFRVEMIKLQLYVPEVLALRQK